MLNPHRADADRAMVLVIDLQDKLLPFIEDHDEIITAAQQLLRGADLFGVPVLATEQNPAGVGSTTQSLAELLRSAGAPIIEKATMSCCGSEPFRDALRGIDRPQTLVCGIEAHVCVQQTVLDLLTMDYQVYVCADAVGSRRGLDLDLALSRMQQAGAVITTAEALLFELVETYESPKFKQLLELVKARP